MTLCQTPPPQHSPEGILLRSRGVFRHHPHARPRVCLARRWMAKCG
ncbi:MAG: hypothetical protein NZ558_08910 [Blastocatellia bacterium]|nr:hypothetical protein [Blastocatellia bacterium]